MSAPVPAEAGPSSVGDGELFLNRELSWLDFNDRVFAESEDPRNPLLERVRFLAITASNLDEFYSKRVGWLKRIAHADPLTRTVDNLTVLEQLRLVLERTHHACKRMERHWSDRLAPELDAHGIHVRAYEDLDPHTQARLHSYFLSDVFPVLTPLVVDPAHPFPFISGGSLSLALTIRDRHSGRDLFARVKVPQNRPRFIDAGDGRFVWLEDLIASHLDLLFPGVEIAASRPIRVLRSVDLDAPGEESDDLLELMESELRRRRFASAVSLEVAGALDPPTRALLVEELDLEDADLAALNGPLGLADLTQIANLPLPDLAFPPFAPAVPAVFREAEGASLFDVIRGQDVLVHHPYESFDATVARFVQQAAVDPAALAIKHTMYRTSPDSPILQSLIDAAGRGKQVAVLVELSARLDEANNIEWARRLEEAGVHVAYGNPHLKIHSKISLVVREEPSGVTLYGHIGTGNYNSRTARVYTDFGLLTADPAICSDLVRVFNFLTGMSEQPDTRMLLLAPANLRTELERRVRREIDHARAGRPARIVFKMNALEDAAFTALLYEAGQAGVDVDLIVRGICRLRAGIPGLSERIRVVSIIGRFLEHARVYSFLNDGDPEYFIGSADLMKRNLDDRIEVLTPITDPRLKQHLEAFLALQLTDDRQSWSLHDARWERNQLSTAEGVHARLLALAVGSPS
ncbi:MAG: polyphosphate kinase 1 [Dehalococcoidia bacterium]